MQEMMMAGGSGALYPWSGPGNKKLLKGTRDLGFFGEVTLGEMFDNNYLLRLSGLPSTVTAGSAGTAQRWLKFIYRGRIIYLSKYPVANNVSWNMLYAAGVVYGERGQGPLPTPVGGAVDQFKMATKFERVDNAYRLWPLKISLIQGVNDSLLSGTGDILTDASEWDVLWSAYFDQGWAGNDTWATLNFNGTVYTATRERTPDGQYYLIRGVNTLLQASRNFPNGVNAAYTWRPRIELITDPNVALEIRFPSFAPKDGIGIPTLTLSTDVVEPVRVVTNVIARNSALLTPQLQITGVAPMVYLEPSLLRPNGVVTLSDENVIRVVKDVVARNSVLQMNQVSMEGNDAKVYVDVPAGSERGTVTLTTVADLQPVRTVALRNSAMLLPLTEVKGVQPALYVKVPDGTVSGQVTLVNEGTTLRAIVNPVYVREMTVTLPAPDFVIEDVV